MDIDSIANLKATRDSLKISSKAIKVQEFEGKTFGSESEYDAISIVVGVNAIIVDVNGLLRNPKHFIQCSNHSDRILLNEELSHIQNCLDDEDLESTCRHIESVKPILRGYSIRYTDEHLDGFINQTNELQKKIQTLSKSLSNSEEDHEEILTLLTEVRSQTKFIDSHSKKQKKDSEDSEIDKLSKAFSYQHSVARNPWIAGSWIVGLLFFMSFSMWLGYSITVDNDITTNQVIGRISLFPISIGGCIFCASQYIKQKKIAEDYSI